MACRSPIGGSADGAEALARVLPRSIRTVSDPYASRAIESLDLQTTPFVFALEDGRIADKAVVRSSAHFMEFIGHRDDLNGGAREHQFLEVTHVS